MPETLTLCGYRAPVQLDQSMDKRQSDAQTATRSARCCIGLHEEIEDVGNDARGHANAIVFDADDSVLSPSRNRNSDQPSGICIFCGVGQQVADDLLEPHRI